MMNHHKQLLNNNIKDVHSVIHTNTKRHHGNTHEAEIKQETLIYQH